MKVGRESWEVAGPQTQVADSSLCKKRDLLKETMG